MLIRHHTFSVHGKDVVRQQWYVLGVCDRLDPAVGVFWNKRFLPLITVPMHKLAHPSSRSNRQIWRNVAGLRLYDCDTPDPDLRWITLTRKSLLATSISPRTVNSRTTHSLQYVCCETLTQRPDCGIGRAERLIFENNLLLSGESHNTIDSHSTSWFLIVLFALLYYSTRRNILYVLASLITFTNELAI